MSRISIASANPFESTEGSGFCLKTELVVVFGVVNVSGFVFDNEKLLRPIEVGVGVIFSVLLG